MDQYGVVKDRNFHFKQSKRMHQREWLAYVRVKGTVSRDFLLCIFHESVSPQPQSIPLRPFQIFLKICGDIRKSRCTTMHQYQQHRWQNCLRYQQHRQQICHRYQRHRRQIIPLVSLAVLILVANCHRYQRYWRQIGHWCKQHWWQTMGTIIKLLTT